MINEKNARKYCYQDISLIENYDKAISDTEHMWHCHHRVETIMNCGRNELIAQGCYYDRPAHDLIFLSKEEHMQLHKKGNKDWLGRKHSEESKKKMSEALKGNKHALGCHRSEEEKKMLSEANRGNKNCLGRKLSDETKRKISEARRRYWANRRAKA